MGSVAASMEPHLRARAGDDERLLREDLRGEKVGEEVDGHHAQQDAQQRVEVQRPEGDLAEDEEAARLQPYCTGGCRRMWQRCRKEISLGPPARRVGWRRRTVRRTIRRTVCRACRQILPAGSSRCKPASRARSAAPRQPAPGRREQSIREAGSAGCGGASDRTLRINARAHPARQVEQARLALVHAHVHLAHA